LGELRMNFYSEEVKHRQVFVENDLYLFHKRLQRLISL
jgi:hypothetical protein